MRKSKWVPLPLCRLFLVGEPSTAQLGLLKVSELLGNLYCSKQRFFFSLVAVFGTKLKAGGKWRRTAECGWALLDFLRFSLLLCFFALLFVFSISDSFLGMFQKNKKSKIDESQRNGIHLVLKAQLIYVEEGCSQKPWGKNNLLNSFML